MTASTTLRSQLLVSAVAALGTLLAPVAEAIRPVEIAKLTASDAAAFDMFGRSVDLDGGLTLVGARGDDDSGAGSGSAYLFDATTGFQLAKLTPRDGDSSDLFGQSVALDGGLALVGAPWDDDNGSQSGSAYLFDAATGKQVAKLTPSDADAQDIFGESVALDSGLALVGAFGNGDNGFNSGSAYLFDAASGDQLAKLTPADAGWGDIFGASVALDGGLALVGAFGDDGNGSQSGSAYLFDASTGQQLAKLTPGDGAAGDEFGRSVALDGGLALVGALRDDDNGPNSGSAYLFDTVSGAQLAKLTAGDGASSDFFGVSVALDGGLALVGAVEDDDNGSRSGSAYLFDTVTGAQLAKLTSGDGAQDDFFGISLAFDGGLALVGAVGDDDNGPDSGSAYLFRIVPEPATGLLAALALLSFSAWRRRSALTAVC